MSLRRTVLHTTFVAYLAIQLMGGNDASAQYPAHPCLHATTVDVGVTPLDGGRIRSSTLYRLPVSAGGGVALDVVTPIADPENVRLELVEARCPDAAQQLNVIRETPRSLLLGLREPGAVYFKVASEDPPAALRHVALHVALAAEPESPGALLTLDVNPPAVCSSSDLPSIGPGDERYVLVTREPDFTKDVEPEDCDVLESTFSEPGVVIVEAEGGPVDAALFAGRGCTRPLVEGVLGEAGQSFVAPIFAGSHRIALGAPDVPALTYSLAVKHLPLCPAGRHSGLLRCGAVLDAGVPFDGTLETGHERAYTFVLETLSTVVVTVEGGLVDGALYDSDGVRLAARIACHDTGCGLVTTLPEGRYGLRLAGMDAEPVRYVVTLTDVR